MKNLKKISTLQKGQHFEQLAEEFLKKQGLLYITKNFRSKYGEIDRIMSHKDTLVFIEIRYRTCTHFGHGFETVTRSKQQRLIKTAAFYLQQNPRKKNLPCRFDVISIQANQQIDWIKNAFSVQ